MIHSERPAEHARARLLTCGEDGGCAESLHIRHNSPLYGMTGIPTCVLSRQSVVSLAEMLFGKKFRCGHGLFIHFRDL